MAGPVYVMNPREIPELQQSPWGNASGKEPVRKAMLSGWVDDNPNSSKRSPNGMMDLTRTWAMKDADQEDFADAGLDGPKPGGVDLMALTPVHGDHRNALFYDWHVGKLSTEKLKKDEPKN
jgi:prepilin-type processing-associated H-X9-DG protein